MKEKITASLINTEHGLGDAGYTRRAFELLGTGGPENTLITYVHSTCYTEALIFTFQEFTHTLGQRCSLFSKEKMTKTARMHLYKHKARPLTKYHHLNAAKREAELVMLVLLTACPSVNGATVVAAELCPLQGPFNSHAHTHKEPYVPLDVEEVEAFLNNLQPAFVLRRAAA